MFLNKELFFAIAVRFLVFLSSGWILSGYLFNLPSNHPLSVANQSYINNLLIKRSSNLHVDDFPGSALIVGFDNRFCVVDKRNKFQPLTNEVIILREDEGCPIGSKVDRYRITEMLSNLAAGKQKAILLDVVFAEKGCDQDTELLVRQILKTSEITPIVMPYKIKGAVEPYQVGKTIFESCIEKLSDNDLEFLFRSNRIFFGHTLLYPDQQNGQFTHTRFSILATIATNEISEFGNPIRAEVEIPSVSLIMALLSSNTGHSIIKEDALQRLSNMGYVFTLRPKFPEQVSSNYSECQLYAPEKCDASQSLSQEIRISYRAKFREDFDPPSPITSYSAEQFTFQSARTLIDDRFADPNFIIFAGTSPIYGDEIATPIGGMPGGAILANATFDFLDQGNIKTKTRYEQLRENRLYVVCVSFLTLICSFFLSYGIWKYLAKKADIINMPTSKHVFHTIWPFFVLVFTGIVLFFSLRNIDQNLDTGIASLAFAALIASMFDVIPAIQNIAESFLAAMLSGFKHVQVATTDYLKKIKAAKKDKNSN